MVIAPASASTIAKMAHGVADNMLITTYLSMKAPVFVAPAMDLDMFKHTATQNNLDILKSYGNFIIEPTSGELASALIGKGRMEEPEKINAILENYFVEQAMKKEKEQNLSGQVILVTAGPTHEQIDPVRYISNYSSGKMGFALAEECAQRGAIVQLVCGPVALTTHHHNINRTDVTTAAEMFETCVKVFPLCSSAIMCAAVADFTPETVAEQKIKREKGGQGEEGESEFLLRLVPTHDIAAALGKAKNPDQTLVGFALETHDEIIHATEKVRRKGLDFIVLNSLKEKGTCFGSDNNKITIITKDGRSVPFDFKSKDLVAKDIIDFMVSNKAK
jgi:phosphopantothenoylcysteine decarboxylase/phosphopantothenate--cysteine ligase